MFLCEAEGSRPKLIFSLSPQLSKETIYVITSHINFDHLSNKQFAWLHSYTSSDRKLNKCFKNVKSLQLK
jgi:hypothetical protein